MHTFFVYILECADGTLYAGSTNNLERRVHEHNTARNGAHYTKIRRPVFLRYSELHATYSAARSREAALKRLSRSEKFTLITRAKSAHATIPSLSIADTNMGKGDNSQRKEKKKPKKEKKK